MSNQSSVKQALDALGKDTKSIVLKLRELNVKGDKRSVCSCPIANYLKAAGGQHVSVGGSYFFHYLQGGYVKEVMPQHIANWIAAFDAGTFPEFDSADRSNE